MLKRAPLGLSVALLFCYPVSNAEAGMNKCTDGRRITYTTEPCEKAGLNSAGPIKDAVTVMPIAPRLQKEPLEKSGQEQGNGGNKQNYKAPVNDESGADVSREVTIKPVSPLVNKMLNW